MRSIRRTLTKTESEWALTGGNISLWRQSVIEWSSPPPITRNEENMCWECILLYPSSTLLPPPPPPIFLPFNKSFVRTEIRDNFTSLQSTSRVISVTSKWWCIKKASSKLRHGVFVPGNNTTMLKVLSESDLKYMRDQLLHLIFTLIFKMIMGVACQTWNIRWRILPPEMCFPDCLKGSVKSLWNLKSWWERICHLPLDLSSCPCVNEIWD